MYITTPLIVVYTLLHGAMELLNHTLLHLHASCHRRVRGGEEEDDGLPQYPMANGGGAVGARGKGSGDDRRTGLDVLLASSAAVLSTAPPPSSMTSTIQASELRGEEILCFIVAIVYSRQELIELYGSTLSYFIAATTHEVSPEP